MPIYGSSLEWSILSVGLDESGSVWKGSMSISVSVAGG